MNVRLGVVVRGLWSVCLMRIGRWSEERSWIALHEERRARSGEAKDMAGEVWLVLGLKGLRVGVSV